MIASPSPLAPPAAPAAPAAAAAPDSAAAAAAPWADDDARWEAVQRREAAAASGVAKKLTRSRRGRRAGQVGRQ